MSQDSSNKIDAFISVLREWEVHCIPYDRYSCIEGINRFQKPLRSYISFLDCVATRYLRKYKETSLLILPIYLKGGDLYVSKSNSFQIVDLVVNSKLIHSITTIRLSELTIEMNFAYMNEDFFRKFPFLRKLRFHQGCTDETLRILVRCFPKLTLLDCSKDPDCQITDNGLELLGRLRTLRHVFFNKFYPRHDRLMAKYTGTGIALLMKSLPVLVKITCTKVEMIDALTNLKLSQSVLRTVTSLDFTGHYLNSNILATTTNICPNIERLAISASPEDESLVVMRLRPLKKIKELHVYMYESDGQIPNLIRFVSSSLGMHLEVLDLIEIKLAPTEVNYLGTGCVKLKILTIFVTGEMDYRITRTLLFPRLVTLKFNGFDMRWLHLFIHGRSSLVRLYIIYPQGDDITPLFRQIMGTEMCPKLEIILLCVERDYQRNLLIHMVNVFPKLKLIIIENAQIELRDTLTSLQGNKVALQAVIGFLRVDCYEQDYLDGRKDYNL